MNDPEYLVRGTMRSSRCVFDITIHYEIAVQENSSGSILQTIQLLRQIGCWAFFISIFQLLTLDIIGSVGKRKLPGTGTSFDDPDHAASMILMKMAHQYFSDPGRINACRTQVAMDLQLAVNFKTQPGVQHQHIFGRDDGKRL